MSKWVEITRNTFSQSTNERNRGLKTPSCILRRDNIVYGTDPTWQVTDVYRRKDSVGLPLPVIVSVHGGGWVYGTKEDYQFYCMDLAERGFAVVNFTYRLAPESKYPAPVEDTNLLFTWVMDHADEYGFDTEHIFAVGDSAGAHTLAIYAAVCTNEDYAQDYDFRVPEGFRFAALALNCGEYNVELDSAPDEDMIDSLMRDYLPEEGTCEECVKASPVRYVTENFPPVYLMTSSADFLKPQAPLMAARLTECNVPFVYKFYGSSEYQLRHVFHLDMKSPDARICNDEECSFFKSYI